MAKWQKIAPEEHFLTPAMEEYWAPTVVDIDRPIHDRLHARLVNLGGWRLAAMDRSGITRAHPGDDLRGVFGRISGLRDGRARRRPGDVFRWLPW